MPQAMRFRDLIDRLVPRQRPKPKVFPFLLHGKGTLLGSVVTNRPITQAEKEVKSLEKDESQERKSSNWQSSGRKLRLLIGQL